MSKVSVVIPALNEEEPITGVVHECFATRVPSEVIVVDNGSTDCTAERAREAVRDAERAGVPRHSQRRRQPNQREIRFAGVDGAIVARRRGRALRRILRLSCRGRSGDRRE